MAWVSAGVLATGVAAAAISGAGYASADDDTGASETSSHAAADSPAESPAGPTAGSVPDDPTDPEGTDAQADAPAEERAVVEDAAAEDGDISDTEDETAEVTDGTASSHGSDAAGGDPGPTDRGDPTDGPSTDSEGVDPTVADAAHDAPVRDEVASEEMAGEVPSGSPGVTANRGRHPEAPTGAAATEDAVPSVNSAAVTMSSVQEVAAARPSLLNVVGSFFWGVFDLFSKLVDLSPTIPPGSTVTAGRSTVEIDCGDGYTADADWYFPTDGEPEKFLYFQHGFPARAGFYNVTLQELAERNNAIVVAPSITSNIFACDACAMSGEPMQAAVARLFEGDRAALVASARAAGFDGVLPEKFVITGQSAGASLAVAAAGYYYQLAPADQRSNLAGVLLYEVSAIGGAGTGNALTNALRKLPAAVPVLHIAAEPNMLNSQGSGNVVFEEERPGQFNGIQLIGGAHSDAFRSSTLLGIPQFIVTLFFGASTPQNVEAVQVISRGWLTDMYAGRVYNPATRTGIYGDPGEPGTVVVDIPTVKGLARGHVLPVPPTASSPFDRVVNAFFGLINVNLFARCAVDTHETARRQSVLGCSR